ncbi:ParB-like nuclease domain-containing protein [Faunimonas pinastri]|uniref:ParB-like nuclease domain-containing protein n=1 Tax=Faunimonas pinastri TaxID=1855383 RepID=A0A1H9MSQ4_9HYPH|nr:ParB/Srx family N-terminal domain-containing protein [Faunimonas pinastri]SER26465.1 ParB-like nuclease domain-containing protein [Faunimonas pinastri]
MTTSDKISVELLPLESLKPYAGNAKIHSPEQVEKLAKAIQGLGWSQPIVVDRDYVIIAGHGRRLAALKLGLKKVPVVVRNDLSKEQANALRLADNRVASTDYDMKLINDELSELLKNGFDMDLTGFDLKEIEFAADDIGDLDLGAFVDDISAAVETQKTENAKKVGEIDESAAPIGDAFGFKRVTILQSRRIRAFMTKLEAETGKKGADAFLEHLNSAGYI